jgi:DNA-binding NarL/FixJ family response regulator
MLKTTILVAHHDEISRCTAMQFLESNEYEILQAETIQELYDNLEHQHVDVLLLDLMLIQSEETDVIQTITYSYPCLRIIVTASQSTIDAAVQTMKSGAMEFIQEPHGYIQKPFSIHTIQSIVRNVLESPYPWSKLDTNYDILLKMAQDYIDRQDYKQAIVFLREALRADPNRPEALNRLGEIEEYLGKRLEALKKYRAAYDLDPTYKPAEENLHRATTRVNSKPDLQHP